VNVFFEESGSFKAAAIVSRQTDALQVELPGGRRVKVKNRDVLFEFETPAPAELMREADAQSQQIELDFLWECAPEDEFSFAALAADYFGAHASAVERAALVLRLHGAPVYFRRKGRGHYQRALAEQLQAALAGLERKRQQALLQSRYVDELKQKKLPDDFAGRAVVLLTKPDKNSIEHKALETAAGELGISVSQLLLDCGAIESARAVHEARFLAEYFPRGTGFPPVTLPTVFDHLPQAPCEAFSIDDVTTTEIDDALSVQWLSENRLRVGIHIAAPALGIQPGDTVDTLARERLSTVYVPGGKITMLPSEVVDVFSLQEGGWRPALSLYVIVDCSSHEVVATETRAEQVYIKSNLRHNLLDTIVTEATLADSSSDYPHKPEIAALWPLAQALFEKRQQMRLSNGLKRETQHNVDYSFYIDGEHVAIQPRQRGAPLDLIVAELAILANSTWGGVLAEYGVPGIYRAQRTGMLANGARRTRMQTTPAPHEGLGVAQYAWSTSPLRRYVDLVNQWQLLACCEHGVAAKLVAPFKPKDADLYAVVQSFDDTYSAYADYQNQMERFWCLRWLRQEQRESAVATVIKGDLVRLEEIPLLLHVPGLGVHARGTRVRLALYDFNDLTIEVSSRLLEVIDAPPTSTQMPDEAVNEGLNEAPDESLNEEDALNEAVEGGTVDEGSVPDGTVATLPVR
jgi:exoribonuclease-2